MDVGVDEAGHQQPAAQVNHGLGGISQAQHGKRTAIDDQAVLDQEAAVLVDGHRVCRISVERVTRGVHDGAAVQGHRANSLLLRPSLGSVPPTPASLGSVAAAGDDCSASMRHTRSRENGVWYGRTPTARRMALPSAGATGLYGLSLMDFAPNGPRWSLVSAK